MSNIFQWQLHGDGKTLLFAVLRAAMGYRNVATTSNSNISNICINFF